MKILPPRYTVAMRQEGHRDVYAVVLPDQLDSNLSYPCLKDDGGVVFLHGKNKTLSSHGQINMSSSGKVEIHRLQTDLGYPAQARPNVLLRQSGCPDIQGIVCAEWLVTGQSYLCITMQGDLYLLSMINGPNGILIEHEGHISYRKVTVMALEMALEQEVEVDIVRFFERPPIPDFAGLVVFQRTTHATPPNAQRIGIAVDGETLKIVEQRLLQQKPVSVPGMEYPWNKAVCVGIARTLTEAQTLIRGAGDPTIYQRIMTTVLDQFFDDPIGTVTILPVDHPERDVIVIHQKAPPSPQEAEQAVAHFCPVGEERPEMMIAHDMWNTWIFKPKGEKHWLPHQAVDDTLLLIQSRIGGGKVDPYFERAQ